MTGCELIIEAAQAGDDAAARILLGLLAEYLERGEVPPAPLAAYFVRAFKQIADGHKADETLNICGRSATFEQHFRIAQEVWWLTHRAENRLPLKDNRKGPGAFTLVGKKHHHGPARIKQIYDEMRKQIDLESCEPPMTPAESRKVAVDMQLVFAQLSEALKKRVRN